MNDDANKRRADLARELLLADTRCRGLLDELDDTLMVSRATSLSNEFWCHLEEDLKWVER